MAGFCSSCGTAIADGVNFCPACGKPAGPASAAPVSASPVYTAPSSAPSSGGGALKIILIVLGILAFLGVMMLGSCFYLAYRVKKATSEFAGKPYTGKRAPCSFLSASEAADALGVPVQGAVPRGTLSCDYALGADGDQHMLVGFTWQGGTGIMNLTHGAMKLGGANTFTELSGVGDEAYLAPGGSSILMRKGDVMVNIQMRGAALGEDGGKKVATLIADRIGD